MLKEKKVDSKIDLYLSISNRPNFSKITKKLEANPKGFITQVVQTVEQVQNLVDNLRGYSVIPIILYPSEKNEVSAKFLNLDLAKYRKNFGEFLNQVHQITGDVLITSPSDFSGLNQFLENNSIQSTKYSASG
jgi:homocysteine S-methyltransferase